MPDHEEFIETATSLRKRTILAASAIPLSLGLLERLAEPAAGEPWFKPHPGPARRLISFLHRPRGEKRSLVPARVRKLWHRLLPGMPLPVPLPYGGWWLARGDSFSDAVFEGRFEKREWQFLDRYLKKGMTVMDIGAHHGFFSVLSSRRVGSEGCVAAFEPSRRERERLQANLRLNGCILQRSHG